MSTNLSLAAPAKDGSPLETPNLLGPDERRAVGVWLSALGVLSTGSLIGVALSPYLVTHHPLLLIALSPLGRHLILVAPSVEPVAFLVVAVGRRLAFYLASFQLGRALGPAGIPWIEARAARFGRFVRWLERIFARASHSVVLLMSGPTVCALAGISPMRRDVFLALSTLSLTARMLLVLGFAAWIREYLEMGLAWIDRYWLPATLVMVGLVVVYRWRRRLPSTVMED